MPPRLVTVLLVDDDELFIRVVGRSLSGLAFRVLSAQSASAALAISITEKPDILITDAVMPDKDGVALASEMRVRYPEIAVLVVSGHRLETLGRFGPLPAAAGFLEKPFSSKELVTEIERLTA